jgi:hypothetical protein
MGSVDLYFTGLFCHAYFANNDVVIVPTGPVSPVHLFRVVVGGSYVDNVRTTANYDSVFAKSGERSYYDVTGVLDFDGVTAMGTRTLTADFSSDVPKLSDVSSHRSVRLEALRQTVGSGNGLKTFINHPWGIMDVSHWFPNQAAFNPPRGSWSSPHCIAGVVRVTLKTTGAAIIVRNTTGQQLVLDPSVGSIHFYNEPNPAGQYLGDFSQYYRSIFDDSADESIPEDRPDLPCAKPDRVNGVECANSQYP